MHSEVLLKWHLTHVLFYFHYFSLSWASTRNFHYIQYFRAVHDVWQENIPLKTNLNCVCVLTHFSVKFFFSLLLPIPFFHQRHRHGFYLAKFIFAYFSSWITLVIKLSCYVRCCCRDSIFIHSHNLLVVNSFISTSFASRSRVYALNVIFFWSFFLWNRQMTPNWTEWRWLFSFQRNIFFLPLFLICLSHCFFGTTSLRNRVIVSLTKAVTRFILCIYAQTVLYLFCCSYLPVLLAVFSNANCFFLVGKCNELWWWSWNKNYFMEYTSILMNRMISCILWCYSRGLNIQL